MKIRNYVLFFALLFSSVTSKAVLEKPFAWVNAAQLTVGIGPAQNQQAVVISSGGALSAGNTYYYRIYPFTESNKSGQPTTEMVRTITSSGSRVDLNWDLLDGASYYRVTRGVNQGSELGYFQTAGSSYSDVGAGFTATGNAIGEGQNLLLDVKGSLTIPAGNGIGWTNPVTGTRNGSIAVTSANEMEFQSGTIGGVGSNPAYYFNGLNGTQGFAMSFNSDPAIWYWNQTAWEIRVATIQINMRDQPNGSIVFNGPQVQLLRMSTNTIVAAVPFTNTGQPSFAARINSHYYNVTGDGTAHTVSFGNEIWDTANNFNGTTFTAKVPGKYHFCASVDLANISSAHTSKRIDIRHNGQIELTDYADFSLASTNWTKSICGTMNMASGDTATVTVSVGGSDATVDIEYDSAGGYFQGHLDH